MARHTLERPRGAGLVEAKEAAARRAVALVQDGMTLGLGTGSTAAYAIRALGERVRNEGLRVRGVPTSRRSQEMAQELGIPLLDLSEAGELDMTIDGADEADSALNLIKGGGGALLREKLVAGASRELVIICDENKVVAALGAFPLPVAVVPFGWRTTQKRLETFCPDARLRLSKDTSGSPFVSDDGLYVLDLHFGRIENPALLEHDIKAVLGVAEVGLFVGMTSRLIVGYADGRIEERLS